MLKIYINFNFRYVCYCLQRNVMQKWPNERFVKTRAVSGFIFLRLLCPAILNPRSFNLLSGIFRDFLYNKRYTETRFSEPRFSEILDLMNKLQIPLSYLNSASRLDLMNKKGSENYIH